MRIPKPKSSTDQLPASVPPPSMQPPVGEVQRPRRDEAHPSCLHPHPSPLQERERTKEASGSAAPSRAGAPSQLPVPGSPAQLEVLRRAGEEDVLQQSLPRRSPVPFDVRESQTHSQNSCKRDVKHSPYQTPTSWASRGERPSASRALSSQPRFNNPHLWQGWGEERIHFQRIIQLIICSSETLFPIPPRLHFETALTFCTLTPLCHQRFQQKRRVRQRRCTPTQDNPATTQHSPHPHKLPLDTTAV